MERSSIVRRAWRAVPFAIVAAVFACPSSPPVKHGTARRRPEISRDDTVAKVRPPARRLHEARAGAYINANGNMPCAPRAGDPYPWEEPPEALGALPDGLVMWNPCTGNLQITADGGLTYNTELLFNANPPPYPSNPLGGPSGWNWNVAWNEWITPTANGAVLTDGMGTPFTFTRASTSGSLEYYVDQHLNTWNLVHDVSAQVWRLQLLDGSELDFTQQASGIQLTSVRNRVGKELYRVHFNPNGTLASVTDYITPPRTIVSYTYYDASSPSAGRIRTITPIDGYVVTLIYEESTFGDLVEIKDADGGGCRFKYVSHMMMQMDCADQEWLFDVFQNGGLVNLTEPNGDRHNVQYNKNPDGTTDVQWSTPNRNIPAARLVFTKGDNQDPAVHPFVKQFKNRRNVSTYYDRQNPPTMSQPGPLTSYTDENGKVWKYTYKYPPNDPTGAVQFVQRPPPNDTKHVFDLTYCTPGAVGCPASDVPGVPWLVQTAVDADRRRVVYEYYKDGIGTAKYHALASAKAFDPQDKPLDEVTVDIQLTGGVASTTSLNGIPMVTETLNSDLTFLSSVQDIRGTETREPNAFDRVKRITGVTASGSPTYGATLAFDEKDVYHGGADDFARVCIDAWDGIGRPTGKSVLDPSAVCGGPPLLAFGTTYPAPALDRGDATGHDVTGATGLRRSGTQTFACDRNQVVSTTINGVQDRVAANFPACTNAKPPPPPTDGGAPDADVSDGGGSDTGSAGDSGPACTPGCKSQINIYFYDACCIEYDQSGKIIKDTIVQAAVCTSPDAQNNLCNGWDDTSSNPLRGTWGSNCPTGGPDPCFPYENGPQRRPR